jgi:hypothetical protein
VEVCLAVAGGVGQPVAGPIRGNPDNHSAPASASYDIETIDLGLLSPLYLTLRQPIPSPV